MFRLQCVRPVLRRLLHQGVGSTDHVLEALQVCSAEDQVLDVVAKNKAKLSIEHVYCAVRMLWRSQRKRPEPLRTVHFIKSHPQFFTLQVLAENKIALMDDFTLVDMLYTFLRLNVEPHDSLVQQMVSEAWLRLDRLPISALSKFAVVLSDLQLQTSPLMGHITCILDQRLSSIDDCRMLTALMVSVSYLVSKRLQDDLINRAESLLHTINPSNYTTARKLVQFLRHTKYVHRPLIEKCNEILLLNIHELDADNINIILSLYQSLQFYNWDFMLAAKDRLIELIDTSTDPVVFSKLFVALAPIGSLEIRERLENTALLVVDEFSAHQALAVVEALVEIQSRNFSLLNKIASVIQKNLHVYKPVEVVRITRALFLLHIQNRELFATLRKVLVSCLQRSFQPYEVAMLTRALSMLPSPRLDEGVASRLNDVIAECNLKELNTISFSVAKWIQNDSSYPHNTHSRYVHLLQRLTHCGRERLQTANRLDLLLEEIKPVSGEWFEEMLLEETIATLKRMIDQINLSNISDLAFFLTKMNHFHPPLMDRIASVAIEHIAKIHVSAMYHTLLPFSVLNYEPEGELYDAYIKRFIPHISTFEPFMLILLGYSLAIANRFPEELIKEIFSIDFLGKLDCQLESLSDNFNTKTRLRLMELNRAVCLESPEFQVPWFHERYCQQQQRKRNASISPVQHQIHKMLGEVLGGTNFVQAAVITPYFYTVDFECKLDKDLQPLPYSELSTLQIPERGKALGDSSSPDNARDELPAGAQRIAIKFLGPNYFCKNCHHMKGDAMMIKRHLEILGYRVVQIPHFEWNSMALSTPHAWKEYLRKKILG